MYSGRPGLAVLIVVAAAASNAHVHAQDHVRCWGGKTYDTRMMHTPMRSVAANGNVTAMVTRTGSAMVMGASSGRVGNAPVLPVGRRFVGCFANRIYALGLLDNGEVVGWGRYGGQYPVVPTPPPGVTYTELSPGGDVLRRSDGQFVTWGTALPIPAFPAGLDPVIIRDGHLNTYGAILSDGSLFMWGQNTYGQLSPPALPVGVSYVDLSIGWYRTAGLLSDGRIVLFGSGTPQEMTVPTLPPGTRYVRCAVGQSHAVAIRSDNVVVAWGSNLEGQLDVPALPSGLRCVDVVAGQLHSAVLLADGRVVSWGYEVFFETGVPAPPGLDVPGSWGPATARTVDIAVGYQNGMHVFSDGSVGVFGVPGQDQVPTLPAGVGFVRADTEIQHSVLMRSDGLLELIGDGSAGQGAWPILPAGMKWVDFAVGNGFTMMIRSDGQAFGCGDNAWGQLNVPPLPSGLTYVDVDAVFGISSLVRSDGQIVIVSSISGSGNTPAPALPPGVAYVAVSLGGAVNVALRSDGMAVEWGNLVSPWTSIPVPPAGTVYVEASAGDSVIALRRSDGRIVMAGRISGFPDLERVNDVPRLDHGESFLQVHVTSTWRDIAARIGPTSTYVSFAQGCSGTLPATRLIPRDTPKIGKPLQVRLWDLPADIAVLAMGFTRTQPTSLAAIGLPGCDWHISADAVALLSGQNGQAVWSLPIPDLPSLVGVRFHHQAVVLDPGAGNALGLVVSDAATGVIGFP